MKKVKNLYNKIILISFSKLPLKTAPIQKNLFIKQLNKYQKDIKINKCKIYLCPAILILKNKKINKIQLHSTKIIKKKFINKKKTNVVEKFNTYFIIIKIVKLKFNYNNY